MKKIVLWLASLAVLYAAALLLKGKEAEQMVLLCFGMVIVNLLLCLEFKANKDG